MANEELLKKAVEAFDALSPEQKATMLEEQRQSWVRGNVGLSRDERGITTPTMPTNTRPAAPVEGLERYDQNWHDEMEPNSEGDYVLFSQAEAIIAAKDAAIKRWRSEYERAQSQNVELAEQLAKAEADNAALTARVKELEAENAALEKQALRDRSLANETHSDATLWQFSVDMGDHPSLLVKVWRQRKALETQLAAARKALEEIASFTQTTDLLWWQERARAALEAKP